MHGRAVAITVGSILSGWLLKPGECCTGSWGASWLNCTQCYCSPCGKPCCGAGVDAQEKMAERDAKRWKNKN